MSNTGLSQVEWTQDYNVFATAELTHMRTYRCCSLNPAPLFAHDPGVGYS